MFAYKCKYKAYVTNDDSAAEASTFPELISFMEGSAERRTLLFKLSSLYDLYVSCLHNLQVDNSLNKTSLKSQIIEHYHGEIQEQTDSKKHSSGN